MKDRIKQAIAAEEITAKELRAEERRLDAQISEGNGYTNSDGVSWTTVHQDALKAEHRLELLQCLDRETDAKLEAIADYK